LLAIFLLSACQASARKIRVVIDPIWPPFETIDRPSGQPVGFDLDLMNAIAQKEDLQIEYVTASFDAALDGISHCQYDAAISAITITDSLKKNILFSDPYFAAGQIVTVNIHNLDIKGKEDLAGKRIGALSGTAGAIEAKKIHNGEFAAYDTIDEAFLDLMKGDIDAVISDHLTAIRSVGESPTGIKTVGQVFTDDNYAVAVCSQQPDLLAEINMGLAAVKSDGELDQMVKKWLTVSQ
jgi:polar amino acid transport system substrate-binding protein